ncbi:Lysophospholipase L1 [Micromonospora pallida]|uniref:Lysophospholipase L1 n=1 Tax=Micromonospora pallida TaxID=145854 RepID=A0A1C6T6Q8_9ACTN|nr:Lysophospholipase L1 [Micromonospora pallida]
MIDVNILRSLLASLAVGATAAAVALSPTAAGAAELPSHARIAALGDSITRAAVADGTTASQPQNSWSTGTSTSVNSHLRRMQAAGVTMTAGNYAKGGARSGDLPGQATTAAATGPDYVTILIGGNDVCAASTLSGMTSADTFESNVRRTLDIIKAQNPDARVMLASAPSLMALYQIGRDNVTIRTRWNLIGICEIMLADPMNFSSEANARRSAVEARVDEYNQRLAKLAAERANVFYDNGAVHNTPFTRTDLSILDGFHPSIAGQNKIAAEVWTSALEQGVFTP